MIKVYEYGLLPPIDNANLVWQQMRAGHRYRNTLIEIERDRRARSREILGAHADAAPLAEEVERLSAERDQLRDEIRLQRSEVRARTEGKEARARVRDLAAQIKSARARLKEIKAAVTKDPEIRMRLDAAEERARQRRREERARTEAYWGTYLLAEAAVDQARAGKMDPRFAPWVGDGRIGVQIQGGMAAGDLLDDTRLQIVAASQDGRHTPGSRRAGQRRTLRMRVGSNGRAPIWAAWPMIMHRPLPEGAIIKGATVTCRRVDVRRHEWRVQITIDTSASPSTRPTAPEEACAVNLGWAGVDGGMRVAFAVGTDGIHQELLIPGHVGRRLDQAESIRSIRDKNLNEMRAALVEWMRGRELPEWFAERTDHLWQWRSAQRFHALARAWRKERFPEDGDGYGLLEAWRYRDEHLDRYERGLVRGALRSRRDTYRRFAASLARVYRSIVLDDTDLRELQRSPSPESERREIDPVKVQQRRAAPYELRLALANAFGGRLDKVPAKHLTARCHACSSVQQWDRISSGRVHTCAECGARWDQDANACLNALREWRRSAPDREAARATKPAEKKPSRTARFLESKKRKAEERSLET